MKPSTVKTPKYHCTFEEDTCGGEDDRRTTDQQTDRPTDREERERKAGT